MAITSLSFIVFIFGLLILYYALPHKVQWILLLVGSIAFYLTFGVSSIIYILLTSAVICFSAVRIQKVSYDNKALLKEKKDILSKDEKKEIKAKCKKHKKCILSVAIVLTVIPLVVFKYSHFLTDILNSILPIIKLAPVSNTFSLIVPLGISYYTLQAIGYVTDVYWEKTEAETNYFKCLLFIIFFPQITQGPISRYNDLSSQLFVEHKLSYDNFSLGFQRMLWGFFKKMVIADALSPYVSTILSGYSKYTGITCAVGALLYVFQLYADFSGYMDIMCGYCQMLDIRLTENFNRPFFSKSTAELWRRWHISLGAWCKDYIYYPVAMSKWNQKISKRIKKSEYWSGMMATTVPLIVIWLFIGLWHDASWEYIAWGLGNAVVIASSTFLETPYGLLKNRLHIKENSKVFKCFQVIRTFAIFTLLETIAAVTSLGGNGFGYIIRIFTNHTMPKSLEQVFPSTEGLGGQFLIMLLLALGGLVMMFLFSIIQRKRKIRDVFGKLPKILRIAVLVSMAVIIISSGVQASWGGGAFMYANF